MILLQNLNNFWLFQGVSAQDAKIKSLLLRIAQPQNVGKINVTLFLQFEYSNLLKYPKKVQIWSKLAQKGLVQMTWDQDQVDSFIKIFNWTNFEKKIDV